MRSVGRRAFCALMAASTGALSGYDSMSRNTSTEQPKSNSRATEPPESNTRGIVVTTREELEAAFADLSAGDTVYISDENAPYRTTDWLDIDVDDVTVVGPDVETTIQPAEGSDVGGIRIGHNERCSGIDVRGVGYRGTPVRWDGSADRLHGIAVRNATDVTLERNRIRETYPREHSDGGSGISVTRHCSDVRILANRIHAYGDRGIQVAGERLVVSGNEIANGLDRAISCDVWYPDHRNHTAQTVSIFGNALGNSIEGSLVGMARNDPTRSDHGYVSIFGNIGFGSHKSFCHLRGPRTVRNVSIRNNVSRQSTDRLHTEETTKFAGVAIDSSEGKNLAVENNELYGYSGHGINVENTIDGLTLRNNSVYSPGLTGIRLVGDIDGMVGGNYVSEPSGAGIRLEGASGVWIRGNAIRQYGSAAIVEGEGTGNNLYEGNWADGERPWRIESPTSRVRNHTPPVDVHRNVTTDTDRPVARVEFDSAYARPPRLSFGRVAGGVRERTFETDGDGNYVAATITARNTDAPLDVFVDVD